MPEVAWVGLTEQTARDRGVDVRVVDYDIANVAGAYVLAPDYAGHAQILVDDTRGVIVGATFVGPEVAELLHAATIAIVGEVPLDRLWHAVPSYPTVSEVWLRLLETAGLRRAAGRMRSDPPPAARGQPASAPSLESTRPIAASPLSTAWSIRPKS